MLEKKTYQVLPVIKSDLLDTKTSTNLTYVKSQMSAYRTNGYIDYDIIANGGLSNLRNMTAGKYLCSCKNFNIVYLNSPVTGTAQAGSTGTTIILSADDEAIDDYYNYTIIEITGGTGSGQFNIITDYDATTKIATVARTWTTTPDNSSTYKIGWYDQITYADTHPHTGVVVMGGLLTDNYLQANLFNQKFGLKFTDFPNYEKKLTIMFSQLHIYDTISSSGPINVTFKYCDIYIDYRADETYMQLVDIDAYYCNFNIDLSGLNVGSGLDIRANGNNIKIENCSFYGQFTNLKLSNMSASARTITLKNVIIKGYIKENGQRWPLSLIIEATGAGILTVNVQTVLLSVVDFGMTTKTITAGTHKFHIKNFALLSGYTISNAYLYPTNEPEGNFVFGIKYIDYTLLNYANFYNLEADFNQVDVTETKLFDTGTRNYYHADFKDNVSLDDNVKNFNNSIYLIVRRHDTTKEGYFCPTGTPKKIKNLQLYANDGTTLISSHTDGENFIIIAEDASANKTTLLWYNNQVYRTMFGNFLDDVTYTITNIIQIWEYNGQTNLKSIDDPSLCSDGRLSGTVNFRNLDAQIIAKI